MLYGEEDYLDIWVSFYAVKLVWAEEKYVHYWYSKLIYLKPLAILYFSSIIYL